MDKMSVLKSLHILALISFLARSTPVLGTLVGSVDRMLMLEKLHEEEAQQKLANATLDTTKLATEFRGEECLRPCVLGEVPRVCYFKFVLENYQAMGA